MSCSSAANLRSTHQRGAQSGESVFLVSGRSFATAGIRLSPNATTNYAGA